MESAPRRPLDIWGTGSQFLELPFSNYSTTLAVGSFVSGGAGAEVKMSRCVSHKPNGLHDSSQTQQSELGSFGKKENRPASLFVAYPRHQAFRLRKLHPRIHQSWEEQHPSAPHLHPGWAAALGPLAQCTAWDSDAGATN